MEDIFHWCREGNALQVRVWLDDTEHDMNQGYVHMARPKLSFYGKGIYIARYYELKFLFLKF